MSSTNRNISNDLDNGDVGKKKKRLKKLSSNLFNDDSDNDGDVNSPVKSENINNINVKGDPDNTGNSNNSIQVEKKRIYGNIMSYFQPKIKKNVENSTNSKNVSSSSSKNVSSSSSSKKNESGNGSGKKNDSSSINDNTKIPLKNVGEYFNLLDQHNKTNALKREREENSVENIKTKKAHISPGKDETSPKNENKDGESFDYLPFHGKKIVLTGVFKNYTRDDLQNKIKEYGGSVMSAVSSKTHYLVHGEFLEDGRLYNEGKKYQKAFELSQQSKSIIKILDEQELLNMFPAESDEIKKNNSSNINNQNSTYKNEYNNTDESNSPFNMNTTQENKTNLKMDINNSNIDNTNTSENEIINQLWVEKYRPKNINDLVGNGQNVIKLKNWLADWESVCLKGFKKQVTKTFRGNFENVNARCALLSGSAGIGKTTTAKIVATSSGYNVIEFNASDERNKAAVEKISEMATGGYSLASLNNRQLQKTCIIMDEVDGMSSGDKGGSSAILKLIEKTKCPIICICNDRQNSKMRTLANKCYDLKFMVPNKNSVVKRLLEICKMENIMMEPNAIELLWESTNGDMRQMLNALQLLSRTYKRIQFLDLKKEMNNSNKNVQSLANPFEITMKLLNYHESSKLKIREMMDLFFVDYELIPFFVNENYTNAFNDNDKAVPTINKWNGFAQITHDLALAEKIKYNMKNNMDFSLLPHFAILSCICPVLRIKLLKAFAAGRINFPTALGKISSFNKNKRLLNELCFNISYKLNVCPNSMITTGLLNYIYIKIMTPLYKNNINESIDLMENYNITRENIIENIPCLRLPTEDNLYDKLDSKIKSSFTRSYNASHVIKSDPNAVKKGLKEPEKKTTFNVNDYESEEDIDDLTESKEDKDDDILIKAKVNKKPAAKGGKATPRSKAAGKK
ncbi:replication factor C subunit 1, putative [Hepatocystis sp. ex Piliocolobus tephrosceles]|nr:replication factor C subunit 1, putative [Hepatocystis sp. ex Piliocolobus tephrosceles]